MLTILLLQFEIGTMYRKNIVVCFGRIFSVIAYILEEKNSHSGSAMSTAKRVQHSVGPGKYVSVHYTDRSLISLGT